MFTPVNYTLVTVVLLGPIAWGHRPKYFKPSPKCFCLENGGVYSKNRHTV